MMLIYRYIQWVKERHAKCKIALLGIGKFVVATGGVLLDIQIISRR